MSTTQQLAAQHSVAWLCRQLGVARSGFYAWRQRQEAPGKRAAENARLTAEIEAVFGSGRTGRFRFGAESAWPTLSLLGRAAMRGNGTEVVLGVDDVIDGASDLGNSKGVFKYKEVAKAGPRTLLRRISQFSVPTRLVEVED